MAAYTSPLTIGVRIPSDFELEKIESDIISSKDRNDLELAKGTLESCLDQSLIESRGEFPGMLEECDESKGKSNKESLEVQLIMIKVAAEAVSDIYDKGVKSVVKKHFLAELLLNIIWAIVIALLYIVFKEFFQKEQVLV